MSKPAKKKEPSQLEKAKRLIDAVLGRDKSARPVDALAANEGSVVSRVKKARDERKKRLDDI